MLKSFLAGSSMIYRNERNDKKKTFPKIPSNDFTYIFINIFYL